jgi:hypothetical protein
VLQNCDCQDLGAFERHTAKTLRVLLLNCPSVGYLRRLARRRSFLIWLCLPTSSCHSKIAHEAAVMWSPSSRLYVAEHRNRLNRGRLKLHTLLRERNGMMSLTLCMHRGVVVPAPDHAKTRLSCGAWVQRKITNLTLRAIYIVNSNHNRQHDEAHKEGRHHRKVRYPLRCLAPKAVCIPSQSPNEGLLY